MKSKHLILIRSLIVAIALAVLGGYLNELGNDLFPAYEKYVDNVVAIIIIIPMIYFAFVPAFDALSRDPGKGPSK